MRKGFKAFLFILFIFLGNFFPQGVMAQSGEEREVSDCGFGKYCERGPGGGIVSGGSSEFRCSYNESYYYTDAKGVTKKALREDAGLDWEQAVGGVHCGEVKSSPIILSEVIGYPGPEWDSCVFSPKYRGEITVNYNTTENLKLPFAQELGDEWAGTLDTEHMTVKEYNDLMAKAGIKIIDNSDVTTTITPTVSPSVSPSVTPTVSPEEMLVAQNEIRLKTGVLRKLLPEERQDELKCNFAKWVAKQWKNKQPTMYAVQYGNKDGSDFRPDDKIPIRWIGSVEKACRQEACPSSQPGDLTYNQGKCREEYDTGIYKVGPEGKKFAPGIAWQKMALFPNDRSRGQLKLYVCGEGANPAVHELDYPEVFRLGLSANELFKLFTSKSEQDIFYQNNYQDLQGNYISANNSDVDIYAGEFGNDELLADYYADESEFQPVLEKVIVPLVIQNKPGVKKVEIKNKSLIYRLAESIRENFPKAKDALAKSIENYETKIVSKTSRLLAQNVTVTPTPALTNTSSTCGGISPTFTASFSQKDDDKFEICWEIRGSEVPTAGVMGCDWGYQIDVNVKGENIASFQEPMLGGRNNCLGKPKGEAQTMISCHMGSANPIPVTINDISALSVDFSVTQIKTPGDEDCRWAFANSCSYDDNNTLACLKKGPSILDQVTFNRPSAASCSETASCEAVCYGCKRTQYGPSYNTVLTSGYPALHSFIGGYTEKDAILYQFRPVRSDCKWVTDDGLVMAGTPQQLIDFPFGHWECSRDDERVVDVYNSVPFLASVWKQIASPNWGIMSRIKPEAVIGNGSLPKDYVGCSNDQNMVLDKYGNYLPMHGASPINFGYGQLENFNDGEAVINTGMKNVLMENGVTTAGLGKLLYYRLGGVCNANKWWTEKVLNPMLEAGLTSTGLQQNLGLITICAQKGVTISITKYYNSQCNESLTPLPGFIQGYLILQGASQQ